MVSYDQYLKQFYSEITTNLPQTIAQQIPDELGKGQILQTTTKKGIVISDWHMKYHKTMNVNGKSDEAYYQMIFCVNEGVSWDIEKIGDVYIKTKESCIYRGHGLAEHLCYHEKYDFRFKSIKIPVLYFEQLLTEYFDEREADIYRKKLSKEISKIKITPYIERVFAEMKDFTRYKGVLGNLYLDSKVSELIAVYLSEVLEMNIFLNDNIEISRTDYDSIMEAKRIIDESLAYAPSCMELAKSVYISKSKLERGFLAIVGTSVHAYIIEQRLEKAAGLLMDSDLSISEVAALVGYTKAGNFATAFKNKYGILPRDFKKGLF